MVETRIKTIRFHHKTGSTQIRVGRKMLFASSFQHGWKKPGTRFLVVTNRKVKKIFESNILSRLRSQEGYAGTFLIPDSERAKRLEVAQKLYDNLIAKRFDRHCTLVALGGGVCSDLTGFVASTFLRGIDWIAIPTTLVGQVDAAIGGKTAVNHPKGKNLIGSFWQPRLVLVDPASLETLDPFQWREGLAEVIKYGMIQDVSILAAIEKNPKAVLAKRQDPMDRLIERCIRIKANIVEQDEQDAGLRNILNFGHTLAHALETHGGYGQIGHGQAVAYGMLFATNIAVKKGICSDKIFVRLKRVLESVKLCSYTPTFEPSALIRVMGLDKKRTGSNIRFVLPERAGKVVLRDLPVRTLNNEAYWCIL